MTKLKCCSRKPRGSQTEALDASSEFKCDCGEDCDENIQAENPLGRKLPYIWYPSRDEEKTEEYVRKLECEYSCMQRSILTLTTHFARMQFRLRQILQATPPERYKLLRELEHLAFKGLSESDFGDEMPQIKQDLCALGEIKRKQTYVINKLRNQLSELSDASILSDLDYSFSRDCPDDNIKDEKGSKGKGKGKGKEKGNVKNTRMSLATELSKDIQEATQKELHKRSVDSSKEDKKDSKKNPTKARDSSADSKRGMSSTESMKKSK